MVWVLAGLLYASLSANATLLWCVVRLYRKSDRI